MANYDSSQPTAGGQEMAVLLDEKGLGPGLQTREAKPSLVSRTMHQCGGGAVFLG